VNLHPGAEISAAPLTISTPHRLPVRSTLPYISHVRRRIPTGGGAAAAQAAAGVDRRQSFGLGVEAPTRSLTSSR